MGSRLQLVAGSLLRVLVPLLLLLSLSLAAAPVQACNSTTTGTVTVPTFGSSPPPVSHSSVEINAVYVTAFLAGTDYELVAVGGTSSVSIGSNGAVVPDFNVAWYRDNNGQGSLIANHNQPGNQEGLVPSAADYGVVYMRYGPDLLNDSSLLGADFRLSSGC